MSIHKEHDQGDPFAIDVSTASPLDPRDAEMHLDELLGMRGRVTLLERRLHEVDVRAEEAMQKNQRRTVKALTAAVEFIDELRILAADARTQLEKQAAAAEAEARAELDKPSPILGIFERKPEPPPKPPASIESDWIKVFERLASSARRRMEDHAVFHVPLEGEDLKTLEFEGQPLQRWVSVKNKPEGEALVVQRVDRGLWVAKLDGKVLPIQRGEVHVQ